MYLFLTIFIFVTLFFVILFHFKKKKILKHLCQMSEQEKCQLVDAICSPMGYRFDCNQEIVSTRLDAWQKDFGYTYAFDRFAPHFNMVFDAQPVYFDYGGKTWLIEFWKGQYGITTGCEIGVYHADEIIPVNARKKTLFKVVDEHEMLEMSFSLRKETTSLAAFEERHWWLTAFVMGIFTRPKDLYMDIGLTFPNCDMLSAFVRAMMDLGYTERNMSIYGRRITFTFARSFTDRCSLFCRFTRRFALWRCKVLCKLYNRMVRPLSDTADQLLYLYFYLPSAFRRAFGLHVRNRKGRKRQRKLYKTAHKNIST